MAARYKPNDKFIAYNRIYFKDKLDEKVMIEIEEDVKHMHLETNGKI